MTRRSKKEKVRGKCPKKRKTPSPKTGTKKDGYKEHTNIIESKVIFIPKVKS